MNKPYTQDQLDHYILVGGKTRPEYGMIKQLMEELKAEKSHNMLFSRLKEMDDNGHDALVKAHRELEESHAELNEMLDELTKG